MLILNVGPGRCVKKIGPTKTGSEFSDTEAANLGIFSGRGI